ncbi:MAG: tRNA preQ1(34) S-adenosylmethionine ribosyltransferase-isomerase QueA [Desulfobacteraceae bacterium]
MHSVTDYHFELPEDRIAQEPSALRDESKLFVLNRSDGTYGHYRFLDIPGLLEPTDLLVVNNTRVVPARLTGRKDTGGKIEVLIIDYAGGMKTLETEGVFRCDCLVKASRGPGQGDGLILEDEIHARVVNVKDGFYEIEFDEIGSGISDFLQRKGDIPLPPYIKRSGGRAFEADRENYQTVYARCDGAVAAPTAGLHFTDSLMQELGRKGIEFADITLHVGYGTFVPVRVDDIREHRMHSEFFTVSKETARKINSAKAAGRRVIAVGTTSVRTLEYLWQQSGAIMPGSGMCDIFIHPPYTFRCVDAMVTNFHLPRSTLLMLVSAFAGRETILSAYRTAVEQQYRFFSYGDAMLIGDF